MSGDQNTVLVVDDDPACRDLHALWLDDEYHVLQAATGTEALERIEPADVVLLDREMPGMDGETVASRIREREYSCFVIMVSGVEPDFDVVDLPVDEYLTKPVRRETVVDVVDTMLQRDLTQRLLQEYLSLAARKASLERQKRPTELSGSDAYRRLVADLEAKRVAVLELLDELDGERRDALLAVVDEDDAMTAAIQ